jgi:integrase/recombinase XerD
MIESIFVFESTRSRQREAPLFREREQYLSYMLDQGVSIYALRRSEVVNLTLDDFDWVDETFTVRRVKRGRVQQFPIQFEVGEIIFRYLQLGRPRCSRRRLFVTLRPPFRPVIASTLWIIIGGRLNRHACATRLLSKGSSLRDIADFLGHRDMKSVSIYAKFDMRSLRQVATFSLAGVK